TRPLRIPTSAAYHGDPVPSTMWPFRIRMSNGAREVWGWDRTPSVSSAQSSVVRIAGSYRGLRVNHAIAHEDAAVLEAAAVLELQLNAPRHGVEHRHAGAEQH